MDLAKESLGAIRNAGFPVYAVPPSEWQGDVMVGGVWGDSKHPLAVGVRYDDDLLRHRPARRIEITSTGIEGLGHRSPQHRALLWEHSYSPNIQNFVYNISDKRFAEQPIPGTERYNADMIDGRLVPRVVSLPSAGPRRLIDAVPFTNGYQMERVAFAEYSQLRLYRVQMVEVEILMLGWAWDDEPLTAFMRTARSVRDDNTLFAEIERAEYAAWEKIRQRKQR
ncbi:MAG TPA: hypothetical protein VG929_09800 [Actinomycetota bacterium]|nr:hypothetical protein [Actinomycetota bacterium]